jgi:hypothetical protein
MARKVLVPVFPSETFYDAVVAAGDLVAAEGGLITFLFTGVRPPEEFYLDDADGRPSEIDVSDESFATPADLERQRERQVAALEEARRILAERGVGDEAIDYLFADEADHTGGAQSIADEAAAGAYDVVVIARRYFVDEVEEEGSPPSEVAEAVAALGALGEGVRLLVA